MTGLSGPLSGSVPAGAPRPGDGPDVGRLLVQCADQPGIVATVSGFLQRHGANITDLDQYSDPGSGRFFQRSVFHLAGLRAALDPLREAFAAEVAAKFPTMTWQLTAAEQRKRMAIMASRMEHCLLDLLWRHSRGELPVDIVMIIDNHPDLADLVRPFGVPYVHLPITARTKPEVERRQLDLLKGNVDLIVLARYMQILSPDFIGEADVPIINIHHSFLPAFIGAAPYAKARERGVKLIGATAHYVTEELDEGPIIEQDVVRVSHRDSVTELERRGADVERLVLARAVKWHAEDRIARHGTTTVVL